MPDDQGLYPDVAAPRSAAVAHPEPIEAPDPLRAFDSRLHGRFAEFSGGLSPWAAYQAWADWAYHLATLPGLRVELAERALEAMGALFCQAKAGGREGWAFQPEPGDRRFRGEGWSHPPFSLFAQAQLAIEAQWRAATRGVPGVAAAHARRVEFLGQFALNVLAPVNFAWTNPEVVDAAWRTGGRNFVDGAALYLKDLARLASGRKVEGMDRYKVGETMAVTQGEVIFRNTLMEVIQYAPTTARVHAEPILIVPAWIMKYYILDLTPEDSLIRYLVDQGFTVFVISWKNPGPELSETSFEDYRRQGVLAAMDVVGRVVPGEKIHAVGYCLGGTVLAITAAAMDRDGDERIASLTLLAAQTDFEDAGELMMFIDESQLALLEDMMEMRGYLDAKQMASAFYALRANEMLFAKLVERYLIGSPSEPGGLDAWLADPTRMPARMHGDYLRQLFLQNSFARGAYRVDGRGVALKDIRTPIFALGAERDHIAPWRSVYKLELYADAETTMVLTGGGHNTSVVSPPGKPGAYYRVNVSPIDADYVDPDLWVATAPKQEGSWWPKWLEWLEQRSSDGLVPPPAMGAPKSGLSPLCPAPGVYVFEA